MPNQSDEVRRPDAEPADGSGDGDGRRRSRRNRRILIGVLTTLLVLALAAAGGAYWFVNRLSSNIERIPDAFDKIPAEQRPPDPDDGSVTFLLGGLDGADKVDGHQPGAARTDTIMLAHFPDGRDRGYLVSIPRDTYVEIRDHGMNKINAAYSFGGPSLFVDTVEQLTGIRVDHLVLIDWTGFERLTDELGGVRLTFDEPVVLADGETLDSGTHLLDGATALEYVRDRKDLPGGDFDRVKRQQNYLRALMSGLMSSGALTNPGRLDDIAAAVGEAARVDAELSAFDMVQLGLSMNGIRPDDVTFLTVPTAGTDWAGSQSIVVYDAERAGELWAAMRRDDMEAFLQANPDLVTGADVN